MIRKKQRARPPMAEINIVPYIDVILVLLMIFMITAPLLTQGVTVDLPKVASDSLPSADREPIIVSVNQQGDYFLNINASPNEPIAAEALVLRVAAELALAKEGSLHMAVLVKGDQGVAYGRVVEAMGLLKRAGAAQVGLITDSVDTKDEHIA